MKKIIFFSALLLVSASSVSFSQIDSRKPDYKKYKHPGIKCLFTKNEGSCINLLQLSIKDDTLNILANDRLDTVLNMTRDQYFNSLIGVRYDSLEYLVREGGFTGSEVETVVCYYRQPDGTMEQVRWISFAFRKGHLRVIVDSKYATSNWSDY